MSFDLFGPATINDIRVGYISTTRGYVQNVSRYDANVYAQLNPGTQFIIQNRDLIRYGNINQVNQLAVQDTVPGVTPNSGCDDASGNTFGLDIYNPDGSIKDDAVIAATSGNPINGGVNLGPPRVYINGGGG